MQIRLVFIVLALAAATGSWAQADDTGNAEELKLAALEALIMAPPDRALPLVTKVLAGNHSDEVKSRALFVLSQIDNAEAQGQLVSVAQSSSGELQSEAIRMIGIGGNPEALAMLADMYTGGDANVREAVLEAYLIAGDTESMYTIAVNAQTEKEFGDAVDMLGAMGARDELRRLREARGMSEHLIDAYMISGDAEALRELAMDGSDLERQVQAIEALGVVGAGDVGTTLSDIYRDAANDEIRDAAVDGLMIAGADEALLELYRSSGDPNQKRRLLEALSMTGSDLLLDVIDEALTGDR